MRASADCIVALVFAFGLLVAGAGPAHAGPYEDALASFTTDDFSDTADGIDAVAASGNPLAAPLIEALQDGRLLFSAEDKKVYIKTKDGKLIDAATGKPVAGDAARRYRHCPPQQPPAQRHRRRARRPDADGARSGRALRRGASGVQVARRQRAAGARQGARRRKGRARQDRR